MPGWSHFNLFNKDTRDYFIIVARYLSLLFLYFVQLFDFHLFFVRLLFSFDSFAFHCSSFKEKDSILILDCIPGILILLYKNLLYHCTRIPSPSMQVKKHHTSDCTDFVLVYERVAYYDHRHSGIDETNILQVVKAVEGETSISKCPQCHMITFCFSC
jgi:hypothetical protein